MATVAEKLSTVSPAPLPANTAPNVAAEGLPGRRRVAAAAIAGYAFDGVDIMTLASFLAEQFPTAIRARGVSSSYSTGRLFSVVVPIALGAVAMKTGLGTAIIFAAMLYVVAMFGAFMLRDGKELA